MSDWEQLQTEWQRIGQTAAAAAADATQLIARARRGMLVQRLLEGAVAGAAILITAAALRHAGNPLEAALGMIVGIAIALLWVQHGRLRAREDAAVTESSPTHLDVLARGCRQRVRLAHFIWVVLGLELVFLTPWWVIGSRIHHRTLLDPAFWLTVWLPAAGMVAVFVWSVRMRRRARAELAAARRLRAEFALTP